ncbi:hypothetical protein ACA910_010814 [Epithemia clementina (nom. ined.)]
MKHRREKLQNLKKRNVEFGGQVKASETTEGDQERDAAANAGFAMPLKKKLTLPLSKSNSTKTETWLLRQKGLNEFFKSVSSNQAQSKGEQKSRSEQREERRQPAQYDQLQLEQESRSEYNQQERKSLQKGEPESSNNDDKSSNERYNRDKEQKFLQEEKESKSDEDESFNKRYNTDKEQKWDQEPELKSKRNWNENLDALPDAETQLKLLQEPEHKSKYNGNESLDALSEAKKEQNLQREQEHDSDGNASFDTTYSFDPDWKDEDFNKQSRKRRGKPTPRELAAKRYRRSFGQSNCLHDIGLAKRESTTAKRPKAPPCAKHARLSDDIHWADGKHTTANPVATPHTNQPHSPCDIDLAKSNLTARVHVPAVPPGLNKQSGQSKLFHPIILDLVNEQPATAATATDHAKQSIFTDAIDLATLHFPPISLKEFERYWQEAAKKIGFSSLREIDEGRMVSKANRKAQYGRILPHATDHLLKEILNVQQTDIFIDLGHGIGNAVLQAAFTIGCDSRGIEVVEDRHIFSLAFQDEMARTAGSAGIIRVDLKNGELQSPDFRAFLTGDGRRVVKVFCNNFGNVMGSRAVNRPEDITLDDHIAGLFSAMREGSILATLGPLNFPVGPVENVNEERRLHGLQPSQDASFYSMKTVSLGPQNECVSWSEDHGIVKDLNVYIYERIGPKSSFICSTRYCSKAKSGIVQHASRTMPCGGLLLKWCDECRSTIRSRREQNKTSGSSKRSTAKSTAKD